MDAGLAQSRERLVCDRVPSDAPDECDVGPEPRGGHCLVRSLAAGHPREVRAAHGLARARQALGLHDEIEVDRAHDGEPWRGHTPSLTRCVSARSTGDTNE